MCMEDIKIGLKTRSKSIPFTGTGASQPVLDQDPSRRAVILGAPSAGSITYLHGTGVTSGLGYNLAAGQPPIQLCRDEYGDMVTEPWFAVTAAAGQLFAVGYSHTPELPL